MENLQIHTYTESAYLSYSMAVVKDRAITQVQDGLKPVQRRILYAMKLLGLMNAPKPVKSARVVGDVIGKYHPHGDSAVYDAMVRMAQPFSLRYPLVHGQGNFGTLDDDPAAAQRYTEAKLSPFAEILLGELDKGTVDFKDNYDGSFKEPSLLPARLPVGLLNGSLGIAVGLASSIPSHNLREVANACVAILENPNITLADLMTHIPGPDFPGGGQVISTPEEIYLAYSTGRGPIRCRARWVKEELARGQWQIVITELPYQVSSKNILEELDTLSNPQATDDKKGLTQQQQLLKQAALDLIDKVIDASNTNSAIRLVVSPKSSKVDPDLLMSFLFSNTSLEDSVSLNMTVIGLNGKPRVEGLEEHLKEWVQFRLVTVTRRLQWELDVCLKRRHILEGRLLAFNSIDRVVKIIREESDPLESLKSEIGLSEIQAEDILEMKLRQVNRLEDRKLEKEVAELKKDEARITSLLKSEKQLKALVIKEIKADSEKYGDDRRTLIKEEAKSQSSNIVKAPLTEESVTVVLSSNLWIKQYKGHELEESSVSLRQGDSVLTKLQLKNTDSIGFLADDGRAYSIQASMVPSGRGDGVPLSSLIDIQGNSKVIAALGISATEDEKFIFSSSKGYGYVASSKSMISRQRAGKSFLVVPDGHVALPPVALQTFTVSKSKEGLVTVFKSAEIKELNNGGQGVILQDLPEGGAVVVVFSVEEVSDGLDHLGIRIKKAQIEKYLTKRAKRGKPLSSK